jgi:hypothetical protein
LDSVTPSNASSSTASSALWSERVGSLIIGRTSRLSYVDC